MAATVNIVTHHGATGATQSNVNGGTTRFKVADNATVDTNNPIPIPAAGTNYSYIKQLRLNVTVAPSSGISNLKFYTDGANGWTGVTINAKTSASYTNPATQGTSALAGTADAFTYTSGSALAISGSIGATTGFVGDYVQLQMAVGTSASPGLLSSETLTFAYDES